MGDVLRLPMPGFRTRSRKAKTAAGHARPLAPPLPGLCSGVPSPCSKRIGGRDPGSLRSFYQGQAGGTGDQLLPLPPRPASQRAEIHAPSALAV